jgi:hypothetical protein
MKRKSTSQLAFFNIRTLFASLLCLAGIFVGVSGAVLYSAQPKAPVQLTKLPGAPDVVQMVGPVAMNMNLRDLPYIAPKREHEERRLMRFPHNGDGSELPIVQGLVTNSLRPAPTMPGPLLTFEGQGNTCGCQPSDTDGDVGPNHYVEAVNESIRIFDKNGNTLSGPTSYNSFFSGLTGTPCTSSNDGDPYVIYDQAANRWLISDFAFPSFPGSSFWQCIGVSQTADPVAGGWYLYAVQVDPGNPTYLGDYPKFALWNAGGSPAQNTYFLTMNLFASPTSFNGVRVYALNRANMLSGQAANAIGYTLSATDVGLSYSFVAATNRTGDAPPAGRNGMVLAIDSPNSGGVTVTQVHARFFHVDFVTPANSVFGVGATHQPNTEITVNGFIDAFTNTTSDLVPQSGTSTKLDTLGDKIMTPVIYQNRGGTESLWADSTVCTDANCTGPTGVRWYQFNVTGGTFPATAAQQQTWTNNNDGLWRWMPSIGVDQNGNTAIGYSTSSSGIFPTISYAGRLAGDPANNLGQGEATMFPGVGFHSGVRWGDYTRNDVDPDGVSFWHINQYAQSSTWHTRIGKYQFPATTCTPSWSAGPNLPTVLVRGVGVYFPADGNFYSVGGRTADTAGSDFQHVLRYTPSTNTWTQMPSTLPDNTMNNMACGVLTVSGTPYIYCVGGSAATQTTAASRVFFYNPATDTATTLATDNWPGDSVGTILPGGFAVANNKLYILGGFNINVASTNQIWQFDPNAAAGTRWTQMVNTPEGIMYAPTTAIGGIIYVGGASDYSGGTVIDTTNSFSFNPATNTIGTIAAIPRATGETRALNFGGQMYVIGGGRVAPNPSTEVDIYNPATNSWSTGAAFVTARRNFPTDTNGTDHIWLGGGYDSSGTNPLNTMEIDSCASLSINSAVSRKTQGGAGTFDINMPLTGASGVECRTTGGTNDYTLVVTFSGNVTVTGSPQAQVTSGTGCVGTAGACSGNVSVSGAVVTVPLTNIANAQVINVRINGVNGSGTFNIPMGFLIGDVTADRTVNAADVALTKSQLGQTVGATNFKSDMNCDAQINAADRAIQKAHLGTGLP